MKTIPCEDCGHPVVYCDRHETWEHVEKGVSCFLNSAPCAFTLRFVRVHLTKTEVVSSKVLDAMQARLDALEVTTPMLLTALEELMGAMGGEPPTEAIAIAWTQALTAIAHAKGAPRPDADEGDECVELAWGIYEGLGVPSSPVRGWYHVQKHDDSALYEDDVAAARDNFERVAYWNEYTEEIVKLPESWTEVHEGEEVWPWWLVASGPKTPCAVSEVARVEAEFDRHEAEAFLAQDLQIARGE
tara:strand:- start:632 stop:1363 length:732 start_codon:yes stop_codon:yes gene_type:complete